MKSFKQFNEEIDWPEIQPRKFPEIQQGRFKSPEQIRREDPNPKYTRALIDLSKRVFGKHDIEDLKKYIGQTVTIQEPYDLQKKFYGLKADIEVIQLNPFSRKDEFPLRGKVKKIYSQQPLGKVQVDDIAHFTPDHIVS